MKRALAALAIALAIHGLLAVAVGVWLVFAPRPETLVTLDLSSVELSFAETEDETAAVVPQPAAPETPPESVRPETEPPRPPTPDKLLPPDPTSPDRLLAPKEELRPMETPVLKPVPEAKNVAAKTKPLPQAEPAPAVAPRQAKVDAPPRPRRTIRPEYPKGARQRGEQGDVLLEIHVGADGGVDDVKVVRSSGFAELDAAAMKAVRAARFAPARSDGHPVASTARLSLSFRLR